MKNAKYILRLTCLRVNHCPYATAVAEHLAVFTNDAEVAVGEILHGALNPCFNKELRILQRHLVHLDRKP